MPNTDPNLLPAGNEASQPTASVPKLNTLTPPMPNTKAPQPVYYRCTTPNASMHRQDGKRLPFINGFQKLAIKEDIRYMDEEIAQGNPYISRCTAQQEQQAKMLEDPVGAIREQIKTEVFKDLTVDALEKLLQEKRSGVVGALKEVKSAQSQQPETVTKPEPAKVSPATITKAAELLAKAQAQASVALTAEHNAASGNGGAKLTPVNTSDLGGNVKSSGA